jgi:hypothetical protein
MISRLSRRVSAVRLAVVAAAISSLSSSLVPALAAQDPGTPVQVAMRGPRFLRGIGPGATPIDPAAVSALRRRVTLPANTVTLDAALRLIARQAGVRLQYSRDVVPLDARLRLEGGRISLAAALTEVLLDGEVDIRIVGSEELVLVRRREGAGHWLSGTLVGRVVDSTTRREIVRAEVFLE